MTLSEVKELREKYKDASHLHIGFYAGNILENEKNFVIWDDDHEMVSVCNHVCPICRNL